MDWRYRDRWAVNGGTRFVFRQVQVALSSAERRELTIDGDRLQVIIAPDALADLGLDDAEIRAQLAVEAHSVELRREYLGLILTYGRPEAQPAILRL